MHLKTSSGKWRPFCLGPNVLNDVIWPATQVTQSHSQVKIDNERKQNCEPLVLNQAHIIKTRYVALPAHFLFLQLVATGFQESWVIKRLDGTWICCRIECCIIRRPTLTITHFMSGFASCIWPNAIIGTSEWPFQCWGFSVDYWYFIWSNHVTRLLVI